MTRGGRGGDVCWGLFGNVIKGGGVGKHGLRVKVRWGIMASRKKDTIKRFWAVVEGDTKFASSLGKKCTFFTTKGLVTSFTKVRGLV